MVKTNKIYLKAIFCISVLTSTCVCAYEIKTHDKLTLRAMESSKLISDPGLLKDIGINDLSYTFPNTFGTRMILKALMRNGAMLEDGCDEATKGTSDEGKCEAYHTEPNSMNGFNHFFDPQNNKGLTFPLPLCGNAVSSIDWATERNGQIGARKDCGLLDIVEQKYSYTDALDYYRKMLSATSSYERSRNTGLLFQSLGHVLHNLQDMAQPEHVRDDMHCPDKRCSIADLYTYGLLDLYDPSSYEKFTNEQSIFTSCVLPKLNSVNYPNTVAFDNPALFWDSGDGKGMAEFTSEHFVSPDTNFTGTILNPDPDVSHDLPDPPSLPSTSWRSEKVSIMDLAVHTCDQDLRDRYKRLTGKVKFISQDIVDPYFPGITYNNIRTSTWSVFTDDLARKAPYFQTRYSLNQFNYESYYDVLIPRAVAFSEGLLDFFFRGRLSVSVGSSRNSIRITNTSNQVMMGSFQLYYDDAALTRRLLTSKSTALQPGQTSASIGFTIPTPASGFKGDYILVFDGVIGNYDGIAAKVFKGPVTPPQPALCGNPVTPSGGQGGGHVQYTFQGTEKKTIDVNFEAFFIEDGLQISAGGTTLAQTDGLVSGFHSWRLTVDPAKRGNTVDLYVDAPLEGTAWKLCIDCEDSGQTCAQKLDRKKIGFFVYQGGVRWTCNINSQKIDGSVYNGSFVSLNLTPGRHNYEFDGICTCSALDCSDKPAVVISGDTKVIRLDLPFKQKITFDIK